MDREILFRGNANGKWVEGHLVYETTTTQPTPIIVCGEAEWIDGNEWKIPDWYSVDPDTVGQYTGLTDRNGKRIFVGDVVEYGGGKYKVVFVSNPHAYFGLDMIQEFGEIWPFSHSVPAGIMTVIGNIHDNPELLEV